MGTDSKEKFEFHTPQIIFHLEVGLDGKSIIKPETQGYSVVMGLKEPSLFP